MKKRKGFGQLIITFAFVYSAYFVTFMLVNLKKMEIYIQLYCIGSLVLLH